MAVTHLPPNPTPALNQRITPELVKKHGLLPEEHQLIKRTLHREPTLTELGIFSVMWSEHCSYKNTRPLLKQFPTTKDGDTSRFGAVLVKAGEENAGIIDIGDEWAVSFKLESRNHPSALDPQAGAATAVGGVVRDILAMGARPVLLTNSLRFGELSSPVTQQQLQGIVAGSAHYSNTAGVPTVGGDAYFDPCYEGKPLVNALCLGVLRHDQIRSGKASGAGNAVYYVGAPTGRDGLGGAALPALESTETVADSRPVIQTGDPVLGRKLIDACLAALAVSELVIGIQDMGAAGLACATSETASRGGTGIEIELDGVPQREAGMNSYELLLAESQERMLLIVQQGREAEFEAIFAQAAVPAAKIGTVTTTGHLVVKHHGVPVVDVPTTSLTDKAPVYFRESMVPSYFVATSAWTPEVCGLPDLDAAGAQSALLKLLAHPTIASKRWIYRQYARPADHGIVVEPGSDAAVVRVRLGETERFLAISNDGNGRFCYLNPRRGALIAMSECLRNLACAGAMPLAMTNNLNFGNPYKPESFYQLKECVRGLAEACRFFDVPVVGGNVSLYNESPEGTIDPTPTVAVVGLIEKEQHITKQWVREAGTKLVLLGGTPYELGGSQFLGLIHGLKTGDAPVVDLGAEERLGNTVRTLIRAGLVLAAHDLSEGGLLVAVSEMLFAPDTTFGAKLDLAAAGGARSDSLLFGESQGRVVLAVQGASALRVISESHMQGVAAAVIGEVTADGALAVKTKAFTATWPTADLRRVWETAIEEALPRPGAG